MGESFRERIRKWLQDDTALPQKEPLALSTLYGLANNLEKIYDDLAHPAELLRQPDFLAGVELFANSQITPQELITYARGDNPRLGLMALEALSLCPSDPDLVNDLLDCHYNLSPWHQFFVLRALRPHLPQEASVVGELLYLIKERYQNFQNLFLQMLKPFLAERLQMGEILTFAHRLEEMKQEDADQLNALLTLAAMPELDPLLKEIHSWLATHVNTDALSKIGRVWSRAESADAAAVISHSKLLEKVDFLETVLQRDPPCSLIIVGEHGVGKTAVIRALGQRLQDGGWIVFQASGSDILAGKVFLGEFEERVKELLKLLGSGKRVVWYVPDFPNLQWTGTHRHSRTGALDMLLPYIEQGEIIIIGEAHHSAFEKLVHSKPRCLTVFEICRIEPLPAEPTLQLAWEWVQSGSQQMGHELATEEVIQEAWLLAQHYLRDRVAPGSLLDFLKITLQRIAKERPSDPQITLDDLILTLTKLTSLPESILDERQRLDQRQLREFFNLRILGQPEAVNCLIERITMIKAGLTDPSCPQGVFLFAGPTGTGKTEIAKTLASYLFGSSDRLVRLDMSEYQTPESLERLLGPSERGDEQSFAHQIRKQPFSVVLLDEFEKAHPKIWDVFLQVFDDGRLTDQQGRTADFRHTIIILTSNLGSVQSATEDMGFTQQKRRFQPAAVKREIARVFRPELLNRIDRVVVFQPFTREVMRKILAKELNEVQQRRGLRQRDWAVVWDDAALEFLLEKGFSQELGARPLKRAVERYLLTPLASKIVDHQYPAGDQFLYIHREGDRLAAEFIDPDAPVEAPQEPFAPALAEESLLPLQAIILDPHGNASDINTLQQHYHLIRRRLENENWSQEKHNTLSLTSLPEFWDSPDRFVILGEVENRDRFEVGLASAGQLLERLQQATDGDRKQLPRSLTSRLAQQLYLLEAAHSAINQRHPWEAFLRVVASPDMRHDSDQATEFAKNLGHMYRQWAKKRQMQLEILEESSGQARKPYHLLLAVSGFAAYSILAPEEGIHVWEEPTPERKSAKSSKAFHRFQAEVRVVPQPAEPTSETEDLRVQARRALAKAAVHRLTVVRRYRNLPTPLVRDRVRDWRTGRLERVLAGDFDLLGDTLDDDPRKSLAAKE